MKTIYLVLLLLFSIGAQAQNLLNPVMRVLGEDSQSQVLYEINSRVLAGIFDQDSIVLDIGPLHFAGTREDMSYDIITSEGVMSYQNITVWRSDSAVLSLHPGGDVFYYQLDSQAQVLEISDDGLYTLGLDTSSQGFHCAALSHPEIVPENSDVNTLATKKVRVYFEADKALHDNKGGVQGTVNWIHNVFEVVKLLYSRESITAEISEIMVWTTQDTYSTTSSVTALQQFRAARQGANGDLKHLLALKPKGLGGVAWVNALCSSYGFAYSNIQANFSAFPTYSWTTMVIAHEMGHNLGSPHTQSCAWGPQKNQALDNCYTTEGGCAPGPTPTQGGTVMSYCHLTPHGINLNLGFGTQPGDLIRARVNAATCLTEDQGCKTPVPQVSGITQTAATISWASTGVQTYYIRHRVGTQNWTETATNQTQIALSNLSPQTTYSVQVRSDCETQYSAALNFTTASPPAACGPLAQLGFETQVGMTLSGDFQWRRRTGPTPSTNTGPPSAFEGSHYLYVESSSPNYPNKTCVATTPCFSVTPNQALSFSYHMYGVNTGELNVKLNGTTLWIKTGNQGQGWQTAVVDLPVVNNAVLSFTAVTSNGYRGDIAIDDIKTVNKVVEACEANPGASVVEWIESVTIGGTTFQTGNNSGYFAGDIVPPKGPQTITITPGFLRESCQDVFVALYREADGVWLPLTTLSGRGPLSSSQDVLVGRMRIVLSAAPISDACQAVLWGEIEDYAIK